MRAPAVLAAVPLLVGCVISLVARQALTPDVAAAGVGAATIALLAAVARAADRDAPATCVAIVCGFLCTGLTLGAVAARRTYDPPLLEWFARRLLSEPVVLEGTLREDAAIGSFGVSLALDVERVSGARAAGGVRLSVTGSLAPSAAG